MAQSYPDKANSFPGKQAPTTGLGDRAFLPESDAPTKGRAFRQGRDIKHVKSF